MMAIHAAEKLTRRQDILTAIKRYIKGDLVSDIAESCHVTQSTVSYWIGRYGHLYGDGYTPRTRGRRKLTEPCERDKDILYLHSLGQPAATIARKYKMMRARASYIIKTWGERGYVPPLPPYKVGDIVRFDGVTELRLDKINGPASARASILREYIPPDEKQGEKVGHWRYVSDVVIDPFYFYRKGVFAEIIQPSGIGKK